MTWFINKPISRLSLLFVLSILVPGSILVYFGIQNIMSQKELTEKRLLEEQNELAADLAESFQHHLLACARTFFNRVDSLPAPLQQDISSLESMACVGQVFIVNSTGEFIWPYFIQSSDTKPESPRSRGFLQAFAEAERTEFAKANLPAAAQRYRKALKEAKNDLERASATNALARVLAKSGLTEQAQEQYGMLANRYGSRMDESGWPFAYYALHQLIQFNPSETILKDIETMLSQVLNGDIPLTEHTPLVLQEISDWYAKQRGKMPQVREDGSPKIRSIGNLLSFVRREGSSLEQYLSGSSGSMTTPKP